MASLDLLFIQTLIDINTWFQSLMQTNPSEANRIIADMKMAVTTKLNCSSADVDRVMLSNVKPLPDNEKDWKIFSAGLEFLYHEKSRYRQI